MNAVASSARRSEVEQRRLEAALRDLFEHRISFNAVLGFRVRSFDPTSPSVTFAMRPELVGHFVSGRLHGGVISGVLDATAGFALMLAMGEKHREEPTEQILNRFSRMGTIDLRVDYLRPGLGQQFEASAQVTRLGGRIASVQMKLYSENGTVVATGAASYVVS